MANQHWDHWSCSSQEGKQSNRNLQYLATSLGTVISINVVVAAVAEWSSWLYYDNDYDKNYENDCDYDLEYDEDDSDDRDDYYYYCCYYYYYYYYYSATGSGSILAPASGVKVGAGSALGASQHRGLGPAVLSLGVVVFLFV